LQKQTETLCVRRGTGGSIREYASLSLRAWRGPHKILRYQARHHVPTMIPLGANTHVQYLLRPRLLLVQYSSVICNVPVSLPIRLYYLLPVFSYDVNRSQAKEESRVVKLTVHDTYS
jgi:hypothetical protein